MWYGLETGSSGKDANFWNSGVWIKEETICYKNTINAKLKSMKLKATANSKPIFYKIQVKILFFLKALGTKILGFDIFLNWYFTF